MPVTIHLPAALHALAVPEVPVEARDVAAALGSLTTRFPLLRRHLFDERGLLRPHVNVYLNQDEVRGLPAGVATPLRNGDVLLILPSVAGG